MTVRVRFAPSPTGMFHVGGARSALQNWIYAKQQGGVFVLRIEDTDAARNKPEWTEGILSALDWIGISRGSYEGPYFQSENAGEHRAAAARLYESGRAYYCDCTREDVQARTGSQYQGYDGYHRDRNLGPGVGHALRFRTPDEGATVVVDLIRGEPTFENKLIEDFVIARGDGSPVFLLANVVDDMTMGITHVIRAEEHLPNTPKQQLLWDALGVKPPVWAHVPVVVNEKRQKLSKRRDKVALEAYREEGYLAGAMRNYLMLLGWAPSGDREIVPWSVIEDEFRLDEVNPSPAFFDEKKLRAFNGEYIRALSVADFIDACQPWLTGTGTIAPPPWQPEEFDADAFAAVAPLAQTRLAVLSEIVPNVDFLFLASPLIDEAAWAKTMKDGSAELLDAAIVAFEALESWDADSLKSTLEAVGAERGLKLGKTQAPVRVAVTGRTVGLPLFESLEVLGRERALTRMRAARLRLV
ncbi:glutamate--tRNA ligase [Micromonospora parathelypteridis]|uniref:Glutamate--tRNA ligase n=1 Tax=Micromonospora parathelypteridis TaxID=1839617 RepID=A0A840VIW2_9ACTN|nr:glutamate--tRNA ligase [Micromonospora parathelypteridis]MBB5476822.1 glutamyl-tRNA synthetase [Micromonospora parathelypteridis]GGO17198.1 glutamate--tRNA ligase [Micromonospora parathelypteridis]